MITRRFLVGLLPALSAVAQETTPGPHGDMKAVCVDDAGGCPVHNWVESGFFLAHRELIVDALDYDPSNANAPIGKILNDAPAVEICKGCGLLRSPQLRRQLL
jgi:hypothetical protein